jgi:hypothetical protein
LSAEPDIGDATASLMKAAAALWVLGSIGVGWWFGWLAGLAALAAGGGVAAMLWIAADWIRREV